MRVQWGAENSMIEIPMITGATNMVGKSAGDSMKHDELLDATWPPVKN
jgi:hypothetical protein